MYAAHNYGYKIPHSIWSEDDFSNGALILIHEKNRIPSVTHDAVSVSPGQDTVIKLETNHYKRLEYPYVSNCTSDWLIDSRFIKFSQEGKTDVSGM